MLYLRVIYDCGILHTRENNNQSTDQSFYWSTDRSTNPTTNQLDYQSFNFSINIPMIVTEVLPIIPSINQFTNDSDWGPIIYSIYQSIYQW